MPPHRSSKTITGASRPNVFDLAGLLIRSWVSAGSRGHAAVVHVAGRPSIARERPAIEMLRPSARLALSAFGGAGAPGPRRLRKALDAAGAGFFPATPWS